MSRLKVATVNGSLNAQSKTGVLLNLVLETLTEKARAVSPIVESTSIELRMLRFGLARVTSEDDLPDSVRRAIATMVESDLVIVGTPIYKAPYAGLFKQFFDVVDQLRLPTSRCC